MLQQYLPFTVLKHLKEAGVKINTDKLQQYLPFTVLKPNGEISFNIFKIIQLQQYLPFTVLKLIILLPPKKEH